MKIIKIIGHPVSVMCMYLLLIISGESFGGFYTLFVFMRLFHGVPDAIVSTLGLGMMLLGYKTCRQRYHPIKTALYLLGNGLMITGLALFFEVSKGYNESTFHQAVPLFTFALFGLFVLCNTWLSIMLFFQNEPSNGRNLPIAQKL
jgi:hypothetical protein